MRASRLCRSALLAAALLIPFPAQKAHAQRHPVELSEREEEEVRDAAAEPAVRVSVYQAIMEARVKRIQEILANPRAQGRREDIRDSMEQIAGISDELQENLDDYDRAHRDLRKPLPKLLDAVLRWESVLKQPAPDDTYNLTRKLALESVADLKAQATEMVPAQQAYFKAHPPVKNANPGGVGAIEGPGHLR